MKEDENRPRAVDSRPHRATGKKPPGGRRPGAGRPPGAKDVLERGEVEAIKAMRWRVPESAPPPAAETAGEAFAALVEVMRKPFVRGSREKLAAAKAIREEVCGPVKQQVEHSGGVHVTWGFDPSGGSEAGESQGAARDDGSVSRTDAACGPGNAAGPELPGSCDASPTDGASTWSSEGVRPNWVEDAAPEPANGDE